MKNYNSKQIYTLIFLGLINIFTIGCKKEDTSNTVTDIDGNVYNTITIGTQVWMKENLKVSKYRNGDAIPNVTGNAAWIALTSGAYCDIDNTPSKSVTYGKLYNWYAVKDSRNVAPQGWHVPSSAEWETLIAFLGGETLAGGKLRETGTTHWLDPNSTASNSSGFTGLGTGYRNTLGNFISFNFNTYFWTNSEFDITSGLDFGFYHQTAESFKYDDAKITGFPVRCIKD